MNTCRTRTPQSFTRAVDIGFGRAGEATNNAVLDRIRYRLHRLEVTVGSGREACFNYVHAHALQLPRDTHLFLSGHGRTGTLLTITQRGVKNN